MAPDLSHFLADYYRWLGFATVIVASLLLVSGIDDLFVDACFWMRTIRARLAAKRRYKPLKPEQLRDRPEQPIAIMVPAWLEYDVTAPMLENMLKALDYQSYRIFVGTYRNDASTTEEVERLAERYERITRIEVPHDGPTCKADCLNWIVQAIFDYETRHGMHFAGVVLHDCQDILHPLELQLFNYLLPRKDVIQLPVASLARDWHELVAGVYMDEFAEWQGKDLLVREGLTRTVPLPGTGTCFSRRALTTLSKETGNRPFNTETLTADYDIGLRLADHGMRPVLARLPVQYRMRRSTWFGYGKEKTATATMPLRVRKYFPNSFRASYRHKAQWALGICFQSWATYGWHGSLTERYFLLRDRKIAVTVFLAILAYFVGAQYALFDLGEASGMLTDNELPLLISKRWIELLLLLNALLFALRIIQRAYFTGSTFGWQHGLLSAPRAVIGHFVRAMALARAWRQYLSHLCLGTPLVWDGVLTDSSYASRVPIERVKLGELLLSWRAIDEEHLQAALEKQSARHIPFGRILVQEGWLAEEVLAEAIAFQSDLDLTSVTEADVLAAKALFPTELSVRWRILALPDGEGKLRLATAIPLSETAQEQIRDALGYMPRQFIARDRDIMAGLRLLTNANVRRQQSLLGTDTPLLGDLIVEQGFISRQAFDKAMLKYSPERDGLIGSYLVAKNIINRDMLQCALDEQRRLAEQSEPSGFESGAEEDFSFFLRGNA
ncbi:bacteriophage N4 adsorption protein B [Brucella endophytica]|uniref:Bacteriophage N4 adsorption protein B n=1 Tax=Brucella endophytica TaxID=1963359 RepID=A0A916SFZ0_9HYPH|nr:glycosyl transferase family protein [Brucella endophytica]GGA98934.1 bacteriophage N4 adsorption protein B [Brucella endophytica]